jgi:hypothetical protein
LIHITFRPTCGHLQAAEVLQFNSKKVVQFERLEDDGISVETSNLMCTKEQLNNQSLADGTTKITINYRQTAMHRTDPPSSLLRAISTAARRTKNWDCILGKDYEQQRLSGYINGRQLCECG